MDSLVQKLRSSLAFRACWNKLKAIQDKRSILLIAICCLTLTILASVELSWLRRVNATRHQQALAAMHNSIRVFNRSLRNEASHLLTVFRSEPRWDPAERAQRLAERYFVWHESSAHGPAIERILLYDASNFAAPRLQELELSEQRFEPVKLEREYKDLEARLRSTSSRHREVLGPQWLSTWLYYSDDSALVRPVAKLGRDAASGRRKLLFEGYLVLQLDLEYVCESVLPVFVRDHFRGMTGDLMVDVGLAVNGEVTHLYAAGGTDASDPDAATDPPALLEFGQRAGDDRLDADWADAADVRQNVMVTSSQVPGPVTRVGGVRRVALRSTAPDPDTIPIARYRQLRRRDRAGRGVLRFTAERPRLFLAEGPQHHLEVIVRHVDGSLGEALAVQHRRSLAMGLGLLLLLGGAMALVVVSLRRASRLAQMRLEFATAVSHELRSPVTAIRAMGDNIAEGLLGTSEQALGYGRLIRDEGRRLSEMIEQTLKLVSLDSRSNRYDVVPVDTSAVIDDAVAGVRPIIDRAGFVLERSDANGIPPVLADETALRQSLGNLLSNAVKYGLPGRWVKLEVAATNGEEAPEVEISVHDRGPGVPPNETRRIFEPYYRSVSAKDSRVPGFGLGLNLAKRMVHGMGGRLTLRSEPGRGSVFTIHLPVAG